MIRVKNEVPVIEVDGQTVSLVAERPALEVHSHWNRRDLAVLEVDGHRYAVCAADLRAALDNAGNAGVR